MSPPADPDTILFFDSDCLLCDRSIMWMARRDPEKKIHFAPLGGSTAREILPEHFRRPSGKRGESVVLARRQAAGDWLVFTRSDAVLEALRVGGGSTICGPLLALFPSPLRNFGYDLVARVRYALFGKVTECSLGKGGDKERLLP